MTLEEQRYSADLDVVHYGGKWREAKRMAAIWYPGRGGPMFWLKARQCFLELGGYYKSQTDFKGRPLWNHHPA